MVVRKSMYERLLTSLEEATELAEKATEVLASDGLYIIPSEVGSRIGRCRQTIRAGKAFIDTLKGEEDA